MSNTLPTLRWGIIGAGSISGKFVGDLEIDRSSYAKANHQIVAVGSSSVEKAEQFIFKNLRKNSPKAYGSYSELFKDPNVDIVYIGTPHPFHKQPALDAINAGKHVLCEKPMTLNYKDAKDLIDAATKKKVFLMEAVWTRFFPIVETFKDLVHNKKIVGDIHRAFIDFAIKDFDELPSNHRLKDINLGGGALLDIGIYSITWARLGLDPNVGKKALKLNVVSSSVMDAGVDAISSAIITYPEIKAQAILSSSFWGNTSREIIRLEGKLGKITVFGKYASCPTKIKITFDDSEKEDITIEPPKDGFGYHYEADAVALDIANGKLEDDIMPLDETLLIFKIMDKIREQCGLVYPQEK
ncbi:uncharacterized protein SAPINGB_P003620 [Magnusiomyces paraingens]|uniref:D-xylose 1-dehydrogenase (NADP(+), D-xylono-1,5-lactone-forming) n=1 Tax=Magnusiomyces paraingens TaxID=2606893 RepID=A0A5E8BR61_9ASCO|nr:uncharacterized protein SAPINGB_P003620 [Saprochaete ingens]VVT53531.1 unnamed protein product [Saprochaete ingens]